MFRKLAGFPRALAYLHGDIRANVASAARKKDGVVLVVTESHLCTIVRGCSEGSLDVLVFGGVVQRGGSVRQSTRHICNDGTHLNMKGVWYPIVGRQLVVFFGPQASRELVLKLTGVIVLARFRHSQPSATPTPTLPSR